MAQHVYRESDFNNPQAACQTCGRRASGLDSDRFCSNSKNERPATDIGEPDCEKCGGSGLGPKELTGATDFYYPVCSCVLGEF